jgi:RNA polymerase sigma-70 factor (ECF subfamily)
VSEALPARAEGAAAFSVIDRATSRHHGSVETEMTDPLLAGLRAPAGGTRERAWRALYDTHFDRVYRLACRFGVRDADVEDVTQRIFMVAHERMQEVDDIRDVGAWIRGIGVRVISDYHRFWRLRRLKQWLLAEPAPQETAAPFGPERDASRGQTQVRVAEVLRAMSDKLRVVLVLLEIEKCTPSEVSALVGVPVNTVRSRGRLAREQFQRLWDQRYGSDEP